MRFSFLSYIAAVLLVFPLLSCSDKAKHQAPPAPVTSGAAIVKPIPVQIAAIGNVEAYRTISIRTQITGQITKIHFKEGQDVRKGDLLIELDRRPYEAALRQSEANLARDTAQMKHAETEAHRYKQLVEKGYVSREQYEQMLTNWHALQATVQADQAVVDNQRVQLQYCSIRSPISGRTGSLKIHEGNEIKANDMEIAVINQVQPVNVVFSVPEKDLPEVKKHTAGGALRIEAVLPGQDNPGPAGDTEKGTLSFIDNTINPATGTISLKGIFENKGRRLWPGQFVNIVMTLAVRPDAVVVPAQAVQTGQAGKYLYVIKPDLTVDLRPVKTGVTLREETVILEGVAAGERIVTEGQLRLSPGTKVAIKEPAKTGPGPGTLPARAPGQPETVKSERVIAK